MQTRAAAVCCEFKEQDRGECDIFSNAVGHRNPDTRSNVKEGHAGSGRDQVQGEDVHVHTVRDEHGSVAHGGFGNANVGFRDGGGDTFGMTKVSRYKSFLRGTGDEKYGDRGRPLPGDSLSLRRSTEWGLN